MNDAQIAGLRRKHAATTEPAKKNELRNLLLAAGIDPDENPAAASAPEGRRVPEKVTADAPKPETAAATPKRRPGRPAKNEVTGSGDATRPKTKAEDK